MSDTQAEQTAPQAAVVVERTYPAPVQALWDLWTTRDGFTSWWGPEGFRVEVHEMDAREGGALRYDMIADAPQAVEAMKRMGQPVSHDTHGHFAEFRPHEHLTLIHAIDFIAGKEPYEARIDVDFAPAGEGVRMTVTLHPHLDPHWTRMSAQGFTSQLGKLDRRYNWTGD